MQQQGGAPGEEPELFDRRSFTNNTKAISYVRTVMTISGGFAAGILGLTGLRGFAFFMALYAVTSLAILSKMGGRVDKYLPKATAQSFLLGGIGGEALAFVLYWTLMYALVHIY